MASSTQKHQTWTRDGYVVSTDPSLIPIASLNAAYESEDLYWAKALPEDVVRDMLDRSLCFGLYTPTPSLPPSSAMDADDPQPDPASTLHEIAESMHKDRPAAAQRAESDSELEAGAGAALIGFARAVTDHTTFVYLTDVYVLPAWKGQGLGSWLVGCVQEVIEGMPHLRRSMLITSSKTDDGRKYYEKRMKMSKVEDPAVPMSW